MIGGGRKTLASAAVLALAGGEPAQASIAREPLPPEPPVVRTLTRYAELLIDGIVGVGLHPRQDEFNEYMAECGYAKYTGTKPEDGWVGVWRRESLEACEEQELLSIYVQARKAAGRPD